MEIVYPPESSFVSVRPTHPPAITSGWQPTGQA